MNTKDQYDYGIIGAGVAGLQLAMAIVDNTYFDQKSILIIEPSDKDTSDKTLCFWEEGNGKWDDLISHSWVNGRFINKQGHVTELDLDTYRYKMLPSLHFYEFCMKKLKENNRVRWVKSTVASTEESTQNIQITTSTGKQFTVGHCFDSRVDIGYSEIAGHATVYQPFLGYEIEFTSDVFDTDAFTMMDYQYRRDDDTAFFYILPTSNKTALIEYTLFNATVTDPDPYADHLRSYIKNYISPQDYQITNIESGLIPMTVYPFHQSNSTRLTKIGTAGSWVRPSSGYAFKYIETYVEKVIDNMIHSRRPDHRLFNQMHRMMDRLLIDLLQEENHIGPDLFDTMYTKVPIKRILKFLDGKTSILEDIKIMYSFSWMPFFRAIRRQYL